MRNCAFLIILPLILNACGEFSYKRGASATDLHNTKQACQNTNNGETTEECLKRNGWTVQKLDDISDMDLFATASITQDNRAPSSEENKKTLAVSNETTSQNSTIESEKKITPEPKPTDIYSISSWWKIGGGDPQLKADIAQCVNTLGDEYKPDIAAQKYSRALVICMHHKGWTALKNAK
jgi:hypothetical protein